MTIDIKRKLETLVKINPKNFPKFLDNIKSKIQQDAPIFGKPTVLVNPQGFDNGFFVNKALAKFTV